MKLAKYLAAAAVLSMTAAPVMAAPAKPAASLSVDKAVRAGTLKGQDKLAGGGLIVAVIAAAAVIAGIIIVADDDNDNPVSS